jgi:hypothetical protein
MVSSTPLAPVRDPAFMRERPQEAATVAEAFFADQVARRTIRSLNTLAVHGLRRSLGTTSALFTRSLALLARMA